jgi:hypothetical protein
LIFLPALREPLFADGADKEVCRHAGHAPIAAVLTGWLRSDCSQPPSPPLLVFAFVLFNRDYQDLYKQPTHPALGLSKTICRIGSPAIAIWCY